MSIPLFDEVEPPAGCGCDDCARRRLADSLARDTSGGVVPAKAARALIVATAAGTALGGGATAAVAAPAAHGSATGSAHSHAKGHTSHASRGTPALVPMRLTRSQILDRSRRWANTQVPYSMTRTWNDGYRQDCSGFVSMAWGLGSSQWTGSLPRYAVRISRDQLRPGDMLLFHNPKDPNKGSHAVIFGGWVDSSHRRYIAYEQTKPFTRIRTAPYPYWSNSAKYIPYRYKFLAGTDRLAEPETGAAAFPGPAVFGPGADNERVTQLGRMLVGRGGGSYYEAGPGPRWSTADREATRAFQHAQGWYGSEADGIPGPATWEYLVRGKGRNIDDDYYRSSGDNRSDGYRSDGYKSDGYKSDGYGSDGYKSDGYGSDGYGSSDDRSSDDYRSSDDTASDRAGGGPVEAYAYPGVQHFRPGQTNDYVETLGRQLVAKGFGDNYLIGPDPTWREADRRAVEAFQRAQGWSGRDADGYPGPETWRRLFS